MSTSGEQKANGFGCGPSCAVDGPPTRICLSTPLMVRTCTRTAVDNHSSSAPRGRHSAVEHAVHDEDRIHQTPCHAHQLVRASAWCKRASNANSNRQNTMFAYSSKYSFLTASRHTNRTERVFTQQRGAQVFVTQQIGLTCLHSPARSSWAPRRSHSWAARATHRRINTTLLGPAKMRTACEISG